jgi:hypothetical protein
VKFRESLKGGGYFLTKALCKDADKNAKNLLKKFAGTEKDCYTLPAAWDYRKSLEQRGLYRFLW